MSIKTISILSGKGGSGKSIISASLSSFLAHCGQKVLLIDLDIFTRGLSFYLLAHKPYAAKSGIADYFRSNNDNSIWKKEFNDKAFISNMMTLLINEDYSNNNLFFIPASSNLDAFYLEENLLYNEREDILNKLQFLFNELNSSNLFDYIIVDTPGGNNFISNIVANLSDGYILVTEADKTSWETIELLLLGISKIKKDLDNNTTNKSISKQCGVNLGFILNKNTLEPKEIVTFLKRRFRTQELVTIPMDIEAVRCYQNDEIPVIKDITYDFSKKIVELAKNLLSPINNWSAESLEILKLVDYKISEEFVRKANLEKKIKMTLQLTNTIPLFSSLLAITLGVVIITDTISLTKTALATILLTIGYLAFIPAVFSRMKRKK